MTSYYLPSGSKIGVGYQVHALANGLTRRGHDVTVFSDCPASEGALYTTVQVPAPKSLRTFAFAFAVRKLDLSGFDVLHAHGDDYWLWRRRVPAHVRTMHGSCFSEAVMIPGLKEKARMVALGLGETLATLVADRTAVVSPHTRRWMPWVRTVVPNGVDETTFHPGGERFSDPTILFVGTYGNRKRGRLLADAFAADVLPAVPGARLVMVCNDAPEAPGVTVTGRIGEAELAELYRRAWLFCLPSSYEGFGIPYAEALASGTPVVASDNPGARFVLDDGRSGEIVADHDLGRALRRLLQDADYNRAAVARSLDRAPAFHLSRVLDRYEELYGDLLARHETPTRA